MLAPTRPNQRWPCVVSWQDIKIQLLCSWLCLNVSRSGYPTTPLPQSYTHHTHISLSTRPQCPEKLWINLLTLHIKARPNLSEFQLPIHPLKSVVPATNTHKLTLHDNQSVKCSNFSFYSKNKVQISPLNDGVMGGVGGGGHEGQFGRDPLPVSSAGGSCEQFWHWAEMSTLWCCPSNISSADHGIAHPARCPEGWFWRGCRSMWHAQTMQVSVSKSCQKRHL